MPDDGPRRDDDAAEVRRQDHTRHASRPIRWLGPSGGSPYWKIDMDYRVARMEATLKDLNVAQFVCDMVQ